MSFRDFWKKNLGNIIELTWSVIVGTGMAGIIVCMTAEERARKKEELRTPKPSRVYTIDINEDGIKDMITEDEHGNRTLFLGKQDGTYERLNKQGQESQKLYEKLNSLEKSVQSKTFKIYS